MRPNCLLGVMRGSVKVMGGSNGINANAVDLRPRRGPTFVEIIGTHYYQTSERSNI